MLWRQTQISATDILACDTGFFASIPDCRACDSPRTVHPECMPIPVPRGDHHYPQVNRSTGERLCFSFMRSLPGQQHLGKLEQSSVPVTLGSEIKHFAQILYGVQMQFMQFHKASWLKGWHFWLVFVRWWVWISEIIARIQKEPVAFIWRVWEYGITSQKVATYSHHHMNCKHHRRIPKRLV